MAKKKTYNIKLTDDERFKIAGYISQAKDKDIKSGRKKLTKMRKVS